jgi:hypothetical protein
MIIKTTAKQAVDIEIDSRELLSTIVDMVMLERLREHGIHPDDRYKIGSLIRIDIKTGMSHIATTVSDDDMVDDELAELPIDVIKIWKAYITLNQAIYSLECGK